MPGIIALVVLADRHPAGPDPVVQFFGRYVGTARRAGLVVAAAAVRPAGRSRVRVRNFETDRLKVNDADGNPVEIAAIVVWQVADTAQAIFAVEDYDDFVAVQSEAALRHVATHPPLRRRRSEVESLRGSTDVVTGELAQRGRGAGRRSPASRSSRCGSATSRTPPEIAQAMLQRQQAAAVIAARTRIVEGAVGMVRDGARPS